VPAERHLIEIEEVWRASGADAVKQQITSALRDIAAEAERIASGAGGRGAAGTYATEQVAGLRTGLEEQVAAARGGSLSTREAGELRALLTKTFSEFSRLPQELQRFLQSGQYTSQQQIRAAIGGIGHAAGPTSAQAPGTSGTPPTLTAAQEATNAARSRAQQLQELAVGGEWVRERAEEIRAGYQLHAGVVEELAATGEYAGYKAVAARAQAQINAQQQRLLAVDGDYARAQASVARDRAIQSAAVQQLLAGDSRYAAAQAAATRAKSAQAATIQEDLATTGQYAATQARATRAKAEVNAQIQAELASTGEYANAQARAARSKAEIGARLQAELAADQQYIEATVRAARSRDEIAAQQARQQLNPANLRANAERQLAQQALRREQQIGVQRGLLDEPNQAGIQRQAELRSLTEAVERQRNIYLEQNRMEETVLAETARLARLKEERTALEGATRLGVTRGPDESVYALQGRVAAREAAVAAERHTARLHEMTANDGAILEQMAQQRALERDVNRSLEQRVREIRRSATPGGTGIQEGGSWFQRIQAAIQVRRTGDVVDPNSLLNFGQFLQSRALTTAGFALSGALLYGGVQAIREMVKESEQLQRIFNQVEAQFRAVGDAHEFAGFRQAIFDISRETGVAASEVATVGFQMKGAFGDTAEAVRETTDAIKVAVVTGLPQKELTDSLTAAAKAYGVSIGGIGDEAIGLEERFGVLSSESLKVFGDMASVAREAGLSLKDLGAIVGTIQQASGRSGSAIAEGLGRILPAIQQQALPILQEYQQNPALQQSAATVRDALASGETGKVLVQLLRDWGHLDQTTKNYFLTLLGGRRDAQTLIPLFNNTAKALQEVDRTQSDAGKTNQRFSDIQGTLAQAVARFRAEITNLGNDLASAGLLDAMRDLAFIGGGALRVIDGLVRLFGELNQAAGGIPGRVAAITLAIVAITKAIETFQRVKQAGILTRILGPAGGAEAGAVGTAEAAAGGLVLPAGVQVAAPLAAGVGVRGLLGRVGGRAGGFLAGIGGGGYLEGLGLSATVAGGLTLGGAALISLMGERALAQRGQVQRGLGSERQRVEGVFAHSDLQTLLRARDRGDFQTGVLDRVGLFGTGQTPIGTLANREINRQTLAQVEQAKKLGLFSAFSDADLQALRDSKGGGKEGEAARRLLAELPQEELSRLQIALGGQKQKDDATEDILKNGGQKIAATTQDLANQFQAGEIGSDEYLRGLQEQLELVRSIDTTPETHTKFLEIQRQINTEYTQRTTQSLQALQKLQQQAGLDAGAIIPFARAVLDAGRQAEAAIKAATQTAASVQQQLPRVVEQPTLIVPPGTLNPPINIRPDIRPNIAPPPVDLRPPLNVAPDLRPFPNQPAPYHVPLPPPTNAPRPTPPSPAQLRRLEEVNTPPRQLTPDEAFGAANIIVDAQRQAWLDSIARAPSATAADELLRHPPVLDEATKDAIRKYYKDKFNLDVDPTIGPTYDQIQQQRQAALNEQIAAITARGAGSRDPGVQAATALAVAQAQLADARRPGGTKTQIDQASAAVAEANAQQLEVSRAIEEANADLAAAQRPDDILAQARAAQTKADIAAKHAQGRAAQLSAQAQRVAADRQMQDAINAITDSRVRLLQTHMQIAGDEIGAAEQGVTLAQAARAKTRSTTCKASSTSRRIRFGRQPSGTARTSSTSTSTCSASLSARRSSN
jgi:TP901 family phage tail tape measure protein